jgi:hypothetical protein
MGCGSSKDDSNNKNPVRLTENPIGQSKPSSSPRPRPTTSSRRENTTSTSLHGEQRHHNFSSPSTRRDERPHTSSTRPSTRRDQRPHTTSGRLSSRKDQRPHTSTGRERQRPVSATVRERPSSHRDRRRSATSAGDRPARQPRTQIQSIPENRPIQYTEDGAIIGRVSDLNVLIDQHAETFYQPEYNDPQSQHSEIRRYIAKTIIYAIIMARERYEWQMS